MGRDKATLPYGKGTVIDALLAALLDGGVRSVRVVVAPGSPLSEPLAGRQAVELAENPRPEDGMLSTILAGLGPEGAGLPGEDETLVICPVDHPAFLPSTVARLLGAIADGAQLAVPTYGGRRGHPLAIAARLVPEIAHLDLEVGLRQLLERHAGAVAEIAVDDEGVLLNVNTPQDYERLQGRS